MFIYIYVLFYSIISFFIFRNLGFYIYIWYLFLYKKPSQLPQLSDYLQHIFIMSQFQWVKRLNVALLDPLLRVSQGWNYVWARLWPVLEFGVLFQIGCWQSSLPCDYRAENPLSYYSCRPLSTLKVPCNSLLSAPSQRTSHNREVCFFKANRRFSDI